MRGGELREEAMVSEQMKEAFDMVADAFNLNIGKKEAGGFL